MARLYWKNPAESSIRGSAKLCYQGWLDNPSELTTTFDITEGMNMSHWWIAGFQSERECPEWIEVGLHTLVVQITEMVTSAAGKTRSPGPLILDTQACQCKL